MNRGFSAIKEHAKKYPFFWHLAKKYQVRNRQPYWDSILSNNQELWTEALVHAQGGPKILIPTSVGAYLAGTTLESTLAVALTLRGAEVHVLLCDSALPACFDCWIGLYSNQEQFAKHGPAKDLCHDCFTFANEMYASLGVHLHRYNELLSDADRKRSHNISLSIPYDKIGNYTLDGIGIGEHALAGVLRYYARGELDGEPCAEGILRRFFEASLLTTFMMHNLLEIYDFKSVVFNHGIYVPQGSIGEVCRHEEVPVVNWNPAYRKKCFVFSHQDTYHRTMISEPVKKWVDLPWSEERENSLSRYLESRWKGTEDWIWFHEKPKFDREMIEKETGVDLSKPSVGMLTSVMWDAQLHYPSNAFPGMLEWIIQTIDYFMKRPDLQLVIRIHPAEIRGTIPSRQKVFDEIKKKYSSLPGNIIIIPPESKVSTYAVMSECDTIIIYNTKTGMELAAMGIPVIVAGEAWIRNKGFAMDVDSPASYFKLLDRLPFNKKLSDENILKAKKYTYHFFFRKMIPVEFFAPTGSNPQFKLEISSLKDLLPGKSKGFDVICEGILKGTDFIYRDE